jgi:large subunit ribosomal protein L17
MRHQRKINHLSRTSEHRKALMANMASSLIKYKRIETTVAKAKALRVFVEPLITRSKSDTTQSRRLVFSYLKDKEAVSQLFREVSLKVANRPGGYTRILKTGTRTGDAAEMCIIELVDFNENMLAAKEESTAKASKRRRTPKKKTSEKAKPKAEKSETKETASEEKTSEKKE